MHTRKRPSILTGESLGRCLGEQGPNLSGISAQARGVHAADAMAKSDYHRWAPGGEPAAGQVPYPYGESEPRVWGQAPGFREQVPNLAGADA